MSNFKESTLCLICSRNITDLCTHKITDCLQGRLDPDLTIYQFLQTVSNFKQLDISEVPQNVCEHCQSNISQMYCFQMVCNKSAWNLQNIKEPLHKRADRMASNVVVISYCYDDEDDEGEEEEEAPCDDINHLSGEECYYNEDSVSLETDKPSKPEDRVDLSTNIEMKMAPIDQFREKRVECPECNKFYSINYIKTHQRTHSGERPYKCDLCPKDFAQSAALYKHRNSHLDLPPYLCTLCEARFCSSSDLKVHQRTHTGVRPYTCEICGKSFPTFVARRRHMSAHSDARPFACSECPKSFKGKRPLKEHMAKHAKFKPVPVEAYIEVTTSNSSG